MAERLRNNLDDLRALISQVARASGIPEAFVEKDFWATEVLRAATASDTIPLPDGSDSRADIVFKGGTSLSRVFRIIDRFSEDIDLLVGFPGGVSTGARDRFLKSVEARVAEHLALDSGKLLASTKGVKRNVEYPYPAEHSAPALRRGVLLEMGSRGGRHPLERMDEYRSIAANYAVQQLSVSETEFEEFQPFQVKVLAPERTLLEKLAAVHHAATISAQAALTAGGRHYYDIARLLQTQRVVDSLAALGAAGVGALAQDIDSHSKQAGWGCTPRPDSGYADSPAFDTGHPSHAAALRGYEAARELVIGEVPSLDSVYRLVASRRELL